MDALELCFVGLSLILLMLLITWYSNHQKNEEINHYIKKPIVSDAVKKEEAVETVEVKEAIEEIKKPSKPKGRPRKKQIKEE